VASGLGAPVADFGFGWEGGGKAWGWAWMGTGRYGVNDDVWVLGIWAVDVGWGAGIRMWVGDWFMAWSRDLCENWENNLFGCVRFTEKSCQ
jgi:hypothetical protein